MRVEDIWRSREIKIIELKIFVLLLLLGMDDLKLDLVNLHLMLCKIHLRDEMYELARN